MRIVKLQAENVKRLKAIEITPEGDLVVISGKNGQGKTSVLDAIWYALGGGPAQKGVPMPIREGESGASVTVDLGSIKVTRNWADGKTALRVESADGARYNSPQSMLDELVGRLSFDPLDFVNQSPKEQVSTLLEVAPIGIDLEGVDRARRENYDKRTEVNRDIKRLEGALSELAPFDENAGLEPVDFAALVAEFREAEQRQRAYDEHVRREDEKEAEIADLLSRIESARSVLAHLRETRPQPVHGLRDLEAALAGVDAANKRVENNRRRVAVAEELADLKETTADLTEAIMSYDRLKESAIAEAKMPVPGLGFDEDGVTLNGVPFSQSSSAEQLRVSIAIAMALNPKIRVIRITDGSLLDSGNLKLIEEMAHDNDFQVWLEVVDETGNVGVVIEDGSVKA